MSRRRNEKEQAQTLPPEVVARIQSDVARWHPGIWESETNRTKPTCTCGLSLKASRAMHFNWDGKCARHDERPASE